MYCSTLCIKHSDVVQTDVEIAVDPSNHIIHLLDLDKNEYSRSITNSIEAIQSYMRQRENIPNSTPWRWLVYATDGMVSEYTRSRSWRHIPLDTPYLFNKFIKVMQQRTSL